MMSEQEETQLGRMEKKLDRICIALNGQPNVPGLLEEHQTVKKVLYGNGTKGLVQEVRELKDIKWWLTHTITGLVATIIGAICYRLIVGPH